MKIILFILIISVLCDGQQNSKTSGFPFIRSHRIPDISDLYGVAWSDLNDDNKCDLYLTSFRGLNRVLINNGANENFVDATIISGLGGNLMPRGIVNLELGNAVFDWDNDGDNDVLICGWGESTRFYENDGNMHFTDITEKLHLKPPYDFNDAVVADIDNDGFADIFLTDEHYPNRLLLNEGGRQFRDISVSSGVHLNAISQTAAFCDVDLDGDVDLYVANWKSKDWFFENLGYRRFKLKAVNIATCMDDISTNSATFADIDNDGDFDLFIAVKDGKDILAFNQFNGIDGRWVFFSKSHSALSQYSENSYGGNFADINNDGYQDIFINNRGPNRFYLNDGHGDFKLVYQDTLQPHAPAYSTGSAFADMDSDGDMDLFIANKDTLSLLLENHIKNTHFIEFQITGVESNHNAIGTLVNLYRQSEDNSRLIATREISTSNAGYLSQNALIAHFGITDPGPFSVAIYFPSGVIIHKNNLVPDSIYTIDESGFLVSWFYRQWQALKRAVVSPVFWWNFLLVVLFVALSLFLIWLGIRKYHWSAGSTAFLWGFYFVIALTISFLLRLSSLFFLLSILNSFAILYMVLILFFSKSAIRIYRQREQFRDILIRASSEILDGKTIEEIESIFSKGVKSGAGVRNCYFIPYDRETDQYQFPEFIDQNLQNQIAKLSAIESPNSLFTITNKDQRNLAMICERGENRFGLFNISLENGQLLNEKVIEEAIIELNQHAAVSFQNIETIKQSKAFIARLTAAEVREEYLDKLEKQNNSLNEKNRELTDLFEKLKTTQSQLALSEKMASLGRLVAGIAHELNNPISFMYANVNQMQKYLEKIKTLSVQDAGKPLQTYDLFDEMTQMVRETRQGSIAVKNLVENLRRFSHLDRSEWQVSDIHDGIGTCLMILKPELKERIKVKKTFAEDGAIECHPGQLNQVLLNLLTNSAQAIDGEGTIDIRTERSQFEIKIIISDTGKGIEASQLDKIFDPFYSSKDVGEGTGLGLSISRSIIENHHGTIEVDSKPGKGSTFTITLPVKQKNNGPSHANV